MGYANVSVSAKGAYASIVSGESPRVWRFLTPDIPASLHQFPSLLRPQLWANYGIDVKAVWIS